MYIIMYGLKTDYVYYEDKKDAHDVLIKSGFKHLFGNRYEHSIAKDEAYTVELEKYVKDV